MNCNEYAALLEASAGGVSAAAGAEMTRHEQECAACRELRAQLSRLDALLPGPGNTPDIPADFHAGWMSKVEEAAMESKQPKPRQWTRILSVAAAVIFVVGGALTTSRDLDRQTSPEPGDTRVMTLNAKRASGSAATNDGVMLAASYDYAAETASPVAGAEQEQKIIRTVSLSISTTDFDQSLAQLRTMCSEAGGWIAHSSEDAGGERRTAWLSLRVPSAQLDAFLESSGGTGRITSRSESATDVTASYYDTRARLETQQALMARLQALITDAADLSDLLALEAQMADTQYQIDTLQAQLNNTDRQVDYATVDVNLREEIPADALTDPELTLGQRFVNAVTTGFGTFVDFLQDALVFVAAAMPFLLVVGVVWLAWRILRKRRKASRAGK